MSTIEIETSPAPTAPCATRPGTISGATGGM